MKAESVDGKVSKGTQTRVVTLAVASHSCPL